MRVRRSAILIDTHNDVTSFTVDGADIGKSAPDRMTDIPRMKQGGRLLRDFYDLGVRYMTLTHANSNGWADSSGDANKPDNGLLPFGKDVVHEMNRLGMMVDVAHVSDKTFWDDPTASIEEKD
jgi:microsomal dipeptidase-like Zn-dependent dipeptidase